jgi:hypothetical protein
MSSIFGNRPLRAHLAGAPLSAALARYAVSAFVRQALNAPAMAELVFADPPTDTLSGLVLGAALAISVDGSGDLFEGEITAIEYEHDGAQGRTSCIGRGCVSGRGPWPTCPRSIWRDSWRPSWA